MIAKFKSEMDTSILDQNNKLEITSKYNEQLKTQIEEAKT